MPPNATALFASLYTAPAVFETTPSVVTKEQLAFDNKLESATRNALDGLKHSLLALLEYMSQFGVSQASIDELYSHLNADRYLRVIRLSQKYTDCLSTDECSASDAHRIQQHSVSVATIRCLIVSTWEQLCRYYQLVYKRAYRDYHKLKKQQSTNKRGRHQQQQQVILGQEIKLALDFQVRVAELCCSCQRGYILARRWEEQQCA